MAKPLLSMTLKADSDFADIEREITNVKGLKSGIIQEELDKVYTRKDQKELVAQIGSKVYKDAQAFRRAPLFDRIQFVGALGKAREAMLFVIVETYNEALRYMDTGLHSNSFISYQGTVGGRESVVRSAAQIKSLGADTVYTVINKAAYAAFLESHFMPDGIMYAVYKRTKRKYGPHISIKYDYTAASNYLTMAKGGTLPRIQIAAPGRIRTGAKSPGRGNRKAARNYAQVKGRSA